MTPPGTSIPLIISGNPHLKPEVAYEWTYGAVYNPKWIKGLTLSADFWHIDLRSIASFAGPQFIINFENSFPGFVIRDPTTGAITEVIGTTLNLTRAIVEGIDYEGIYILDTSSRGGLFVGTIRMETQSSEQSQEIAASLEGSYGLFKGSAAAKFTEVQTKYGTSLFINMYHEGGPSICTSATCKSRTSCSKTQTAFSKVSRQSRTRLRYPISSRWPRSRSLRGRCRRIRSSSKLRRTS